jgi:hypothetical protein
MTAPCLTTAERARVDAARGRLLQIATLLHGVLEDADQGKGAARAPTGLWDLCAFVEGVEVTTTVTLRREKGGPS